MVTQPPGWYPNPDPTPGAPAFRYWEGRVWTGQTTETPPGFPSTIAPVDAASPAPPVSTAAGQQPASAPPRATFPAQPPGAYQAIQPAPAVVSFSGLSVNGRPIAFNIRDVVPGLCVAIGGALIALGSVLTWVRLGPFSASGFDGDGKYTLGLGAVLLIVGAVTVWSGRPLAIRIVVGVVAAIVIAVVGYDTVHIQNSASVFGTHVEVGIGLYVAWAGIIFSCVGVGLPAPTTGIASRA